MEASYILVYGWGVFLMLFGGWVTFLALRGIRMSQGNQADTRVHSR